ncbi:ABC transporter ATP-binding protein [Rhodobacter maris]|uniref:Peptide/nickel transport system ATP-binding protein n=1 Tax=Rhodobacter maris TaxID=446682 RepID=A0A285RI92_9RHOB|nr:ABC transporter ATP-binding protein [Rhodobacter maris]SOB93594.1 peptide/nickel transport system ATP-binding protein [Rhodobacter maris]
MSEILKIRDLRVETASGLELLHGISLDLAKGEILGLIGESGAGKSTIGLAAMGYGRGGCRISGGTIELAGTELASASLRQREAVRGARIAYVAQSAAAAFNPAQRLEQQIVEGPLRHGVMTAAEARAWMLELFTALQLPEPEAFGRRYPHQVSGGQLQRAMVAMAMACKPDILVLDEPTTALDVTTQIEVLALLRETIHKYGTSALYITHDLAVIAQIADRLIVLRDGAEIESGTTEQILEAPRHEYTRRLVAERAESLTAAPGAHHRTGETLLALSGVAAGYGSKPVLAGIDLTVRRGETVAIVGESGSGKSTLARVVAGLLPPSEGLLDFADAPLPPSYTKRPRDLLRRIQLIYQLPDVALNPRQSVAETIGRPLELYRGLKGRALRAEVAHLLGLIGLAPEMADRLPGALSGGQKQRVCIARALAAKPDLMICDEVTSALDPLVAEEILRLLRRLQDDFGMTYLFITHDLSVVRRLADRTVVMQQGRIVEAAETETLFTAPQEAYTQRLLDSVPQLDRGWLDRVLTARGG